MKFYTSYNANTIVATTELILALTSHGSWNFSTNNIEHILQYSVLIKYHAINKDIVTIRKYWDTTRDIITK